jgi:hypothetical protein
MVPKDLQILDYVLDNQLSPDDQIAYVDWAISDLLQRPLTRHFEYAMYPHGTSQLLLGNGSATGGRMEGNAREEGLEMGAGAGLAIIGTGLTPLQEKPELPGDMVGGTGRQDQALSRSDGPTVTHRRRKGRGRRRKQTSSALTPAVAAGGESHNARGAQAPPPSQASMAENAPVREESFEAEGLDRGAQSGRLLDLTVGGRRRGGGRRKGSESTPPPSSTAGGPGG